MFAAAKSISILWIPIIGIPTLVGYVLGLWEKKNQRDERLAACRRLLRRERHLADELADELFLAGHHDTPAMQKYNTRRGR